MVNIISLFIYFGQKYYNYLPSKINITIICVFPVLLALLLASRSGFIAALLFGILNFYIYSKKINSKERFKLGLMVGLLPLILTGYLLKNIEMKDITSNIERAISIVEVLSNTGSDDRDERELSSIARPLQTLYIAFPRFMSSPIFGSGYSATSGKPFKDGTTYFHNDWFYLLVTSGIIGFLSMLCILRAYCWELGWPVIFPFIIPGLTNTFMLNIPAFMFYFYMIGLFRQKLELYKQID